MLYSVTPSCPIFWAIIILQVWNRMIVMICSAKNFSPKLNILFRYENFIYLKLGEYNLNSFAKIYIVNKTNRITGDRDIINPKINKDESFNTKTQNDTAPKATICPNVVIKDE